MAIPISDDTKPPRPSRLRARFAKWPGLLYRFGLETMIAKRVMVLTTRGRVTGIDRRTPLWYVRDGATIYCFSGWGSSSDWLKNLAVSPDAQVQIGRERWESQGTLIHEPLEIERVLPSFREKYGRLVPLFYHLDRLILVVFPLASPATKSRTRRGLGRRI